MKKNASILLILFISTMFFSCGTYRIDKEYFSRVPYKGNEILVYESSENKRDTIFLKGSEKFKMISQSDYLSLFRDKEEHYIVSCDCADPYNPTRSFKDRSFVSLVAYENGETKILIRAILRNAYFQDASFTIEQFDSIPLSRITVGDKEYNDVKIVETKVNREKESHAIRFYWSVSEGFIGLDKKNLEWRLSKKYVPQQDI